MERKFSSASRCCIKTVRGAGCSWRGVREREGDDVSPSVLCRERLGSATVIYGSQNSAVTFFFPGIRGCSEGAAGRLRKGLGGKSGLRPG